MIRRVKSFSSFLSLSSSKRKEQKKSKKEKKQQSKQQQSPADSHPPARTQSLQKILPLRTKRHQSSPNMHPTPQSQSSQQCCASSSCSSCSAAANRVPKEQLQQQQHCEQQQQSEQQNLLQSLIRETILPTIVKELSLITNQSPFLQQTPLQPTCALLHKSELVLGKEIVGQGSFCNVFELLDIELNQTSDAKVSARQRTLRRRLVKSCRDPTKPRLAVKELRFDRFLEPLLQHCNATSASASAAAMTSPSTSFETACHDFQHAVIDLAMEAAYLSRLNHPNIISCRALPLDGINAFEGSGIGDENGTSSTSTTGGFFIVMDLAHETLDHRLKTAATAATTTKALQAEVQPDVLSVALQTAKALEFLHSRRIIFRDLKPNNIGILKEQDSSERVVLFDFGLCREMPPTYHQQRTAAASSGGGDICFFSGESGVYDYFSGNADYDEDGLMLYQEELYRMSGVGTRRYMAPEVLYNRSSSSSHKQQPRYNAKADVYTWSLVMWEFITGGTKPYWDISPTDHIVFVCQQHVRPPLDMVAEGGDNQNARNFWCQLLEASWHWNVSRRLAMSEIVALLEFFSEQQKQQQQEDQAKEVEEEEYEQQLQQQQQKKQQERHQYYKDEKKEEMDVDIHTTAAVIDRMIEKETPFVYPHNHHPHLIHSSSMVMIEEEEQCETETQRSQLHSVPSLASILSGGSNSCSSASLVSLESSSALTTEQVSPVVRNRVVLLKGGANVPPNGVFRSSSRMEQ